MKNSKAILFLIFSVLSACASMPKKPISSVDLASLQGQWEGARNIVHGNMNFHDFAVMEVSNDTLPLKGKVTIYFLEGSDIRIFPFERGMLDSEGNLVLPLDEDSKTILSLYEGRKVLTLRGSYYYMGREGTLVLHKKE
jgi:hypothetical protein